MVKGGESCSSKARWASLGGMAGYGIFTCVFAGTGGFSEDSKSVVFTCACLSTIIGGLIGTRIGAGLASHDCDPFYDEEAAPFRQNAPQLQRDSRGSHHKVD